MYWVAICKGPRYWVNSSQQEKQAPLTTYVPVEEDDINNVTTKEGKYCNGKVQATMEANKQKKTPTQSITICCVF